VDDPAAYLTALGLATAAGLNAWIPLLAVGLLARTTGVVELTGQWEWLTSTPALLALAAVAAADFAGDKIPAVDHLLHLAGTVVAPVSGVVAALASTSGLDRSTGVVAVLALVLAEGAHGTRMAVRPASTVSTAGLGNPVLSLGEDVASGVLSLAALLAPLLALVLVVGLFAAAWRLLWAVRRRIPRGGGRAPGGP
jgi:hypothetical protein